MVGGGLEIIMLCIADGRLRRAEFGFGLDGLGLGLGLGGFSGVGLVGKGWWVRVGV